MKASAGSGRRNVVDTSDAIRALGNAFNRRIRLDDAEGDAVIAARHANPPATWREISLALDVTEGHVTSSYSSAARDAAGPARRLSHERALKQLRQITADRRQADQDVTRAVVAAKDAGATWQQIGDAINMRRSNAATKYGPVVRGEASEAKQTRPRTLRSQRRG